MSEDLSEGEKGDPAARISSARHQWLIELEWRRYTNLMQHSNVRDVNLPTPSFASTTTIAFHSRGTFARLAGVTGPEAVDRSLR
ncbi:hypothetical protein DEO72_LG10g1565 [Vigna unguiculata]|uniref:Uncharacterized protein n=1 Tax=Vigna unguiculata TaxID=3917 RepID=A0A4D6NDV0_VIGUN|nr:hypothetical protein DEO72_LG10g1565 [Vigna unguiculata]